MNPPNVLYGGILTAAGIICLIVILIIYQMRRSTPGAMPLVILMAALCWWDLTYALFWAGLPGPTPYFWLDITFIGVTIVPAAVLAFTIQIIQKEQWLKTPFILALSIEPILVNLLMWTDPWHNLFFGGKRDLNTASILDAGVASWANIVYSYILILMAFILLVQAVSQSSGLYRKQYATILAGVGITWLNSILFIFKLSPLPNTDNTPFSFTLTGLVFAYALLRLRFLDIVPVARSMLIDNMNDGVMVLDTLHRLVDINPVAQRMMPGLRIGAAVDKHLADQPELVEKFLLVDEIRAELTLHQSPAVYLDVHISPLADSQRQPMGRLIVWRDITELKLLQLELKDLATRDVVTEVFNRRHLMDLAQAELRRAVRLNQSLAIVIADLDRFKNVNDTYGHQAGDVVLHTFAQFCMQTKRKQDLFARWGGEEFIFLLPETSGPEAYEFSERLRRIVAATPTVVGPYSISITTSLGVAALTNPQDTLELLLSRADQAMYAAKDAGRNCATLWRDDWGVQNSNDDKTP